MNRVISILFRFSRNLFNFKCIFILTRFILVFYSETRVCMNSCMIMILKISKILIKRFIFIIKNFFSRRLFFHLFIHFHNNSIAFKIIIELIGFKKWIFITLIKIILTRFFILIIFLVSSLKEEIFRI
jgi:hypothetical protein